MLQRPGPADLPYTNIRKIRPFLSEQAAQLLVQALVLSRLDYCNALLAGLPACTIKPLQLIQNAAARVVFNEPKKAHVTPLFIRLHWLPIAARIKFKVLMFAYKTTTGTAPIYLNLLVQTYAPSRSLRSASERRLVMPSQSSCHLLSCIITTKHGSRQCSDFLDFCGTFFFYVSESFIWLVNCENCYMRKICLQL